MVIDMSRYTDALTAEQLIHYIATDYFELSHDKVRTQRDHFIKICKDWLVAHAPPEEEPPAPRPPFNDDF